MHKRFSCLPDEIRNLSDEDWFDLLIQSITERKVKGIEFPGFPPPEVQIGFEGSSYRQTLEEAFLFYKFVKSQAVLLGTPLNLYTHFLDFGCGWGRFLRFFWKDITPKSIFACDMHSGMIETGRSIGVPGNLDLIEPEGNLPYPDDYFDLMIAYSMFTHLPERMHLHWMRELMRVSCPGCIFCLNLEPRGFIDRILDVSPDIESGRIRALSKYAPMAEGLYRDFDSGKIAYLPTGGGDSLTTEIYGDAIVPLAYIQKNWSPHFVVEAYIDNPTRFPQVVIVLQKNIV